MTDLASQDRSLGKWLVLGAVSLMFFFLNLSTFQSLGVVLFTMISELHWSQTEAGSSFMFLGLACGLSSPLPGWLMVRIGGRATVAIGSVLLMLGFVLCSIGHSLVAFYVAMTLVGVGYSFAGNVPGVYLISGWFQRQSARMIGFYLMLGALGASVAPPIVEAIVRNVGWRGHWQVMAVVAGVTGAACLAAIRDVKAKQQLAVTTPIVEANEGAAIVADELPAMAPDWDPREAILTTQYFLAAGAMLGTMACVTTISSVVVSHLTRLGATPTGAAYVFSALAITATLVKAGSGWLCEKVRPSILTAVGLVLQAIGFCLLGFASTDFLRYTSAIIFGAGWGVAYVASTVVLLEYFGALTGSRILSFVWFLVSAAAFGPVAAGMIADRYGTFAPIFVILAVLMLILAVPIAVMRPPVPRGRRTSSTESGGSLIHNKVEAA